MWATENTREALWDAMERREVYGTSGTRLLVRVFAGWDFEEAEVLRPDFARQGYARGVPMGGDLTDAPEGGAPRFMVRALRDPDGANLDRIQIIKGWLDAAGEPAREDHDVACSTAVPDEQTAAGLGVDIRKRAPTTRSRIAPTPRRSGTRRPAEASDVEQRAKIRPYRLCLAGYVTEMSVWRENHVDPIPDTTSHGGASYG